MKSGQKTLLFWAGIIGSPNHLEEFNSTIEKLQQGQYNAADLELKYRFQYNQQMHSVFSARGNDTHRLLLTEWEHDGKKYLFLFDVAYHHNYPDPIHKKLIKYLEEPTKVTEKIKSKKFTTLTIASNDTNNNNDSLPQTALKPYRYFNRKFITLSDQQEKILQGKLPLIFIGAPGAGKSTTCMAAIEDYCNKQSLENMPCRILYLCNSENLAKEMAKNIKLIDSQQTIECLSIQAFIGRHKPADFSILNKTEAKKDFQSWFSTYKKIENIDTNLLYEEFLIISGCDTEADYLQMDERETHLQLDKKALFIAYKAYIQYLDSLEIINIDFFEMPNNASYDFVIYDEAQNASPLQIKAAIHLISDQGKNEEQQQQQQNNIIFCFGTHQNLSSRNTTLNFIKNAFHAKGIEIEQVLLNHCHRSSKKVIDFTNKLLQVFSSVGASYKEEGNLIEPADSNMEEGHVSWVKPSDTNSLLQLAKSVKFAIVTHERFIKEAEIKFGTKNVYTPEQIQGLEYPYIFVYKLFQMDEKIARNELKAINDAVEETSLQNKEMRRPKNKEMPKHIATLLRQIVVACSRAMSSLYLLEIPEYYNEKIISQLSTSTDTSNLSNTETIAPSTQEEWELHRQEINEKLGLQPAAPNTSASKTIADLKKLVDAYEASKKEIDQIRSKKNELTQDESIKIINYIISNSSDGQLDSLIKKKWSINNPDVIFAIFYKILFLKKFETHKALFALIVNREDFNSVNVGNYFLLVKKDIFDCLQKLIAQNPTSSNLSIFKKMIGISHSASLFAPEEIIQLFFSNKNLRQDYGLAFFEITKSHPLPDYFIEEFLDKLKKSNHHKLIYSIIYTSPNFNQSSPVKKILVFITHALNDKGNISFDRDFKYEEFKSKLKETISQQTQLKIDPLINKEEDFNKNINTLMRLLFTIEVGGSNLLVPNKELSLTETIEKAWKNPEIVSKIEMNAANARKKSGEKNNHPLDDKKSYQLIRETLFKLISKNYFSGATEFVQNQIIEAKLDTKEIFLTPVYSSINDDPFDTHEGRNTLFSLLYTQFREPHKQYHTKDFFQFMRLFGDEGIIPFSDFFPPNTTITEQLLGIYDFNVYLNSLNFICHQFGDIDPFLIAMGIYFERSYNIPFDWITITNFIEQLKNHTSTYLIKEIQELDTQAFPTIEVMKLVVLMHINQPKTLQAALLKTTKIEDWSAIINQYWYDDVYLDNLIDTFKSKIAKLPDYLGKTLYSFILHLRSIDAEILYILTDSMRQGLYSENDLASIFKFTGGHIYHYPSRNLISASSKTPSELIKLIIWKNFNLDKILSPSSKKKFTDLVLYFKKFVSSQKNDAPLQAFLNEICEANEINYIQFTTFLRLTINETICNTNSNLRIDLAKHFNIELTDIFPFLMNIFSRMETLAFRILSHFIMLAGQDEHLPLFTGKLVKNPYIDPNSTVSIRMQGSLGEVVSKEPALVNFLRSKIPGGFCHVFFQHTFLDVNTPYPISDFSAIQTPLVVLFLTASSNYAKKTYIATPYPISTVIDSTYRPICYVEMQAGFKPTLTNIFSFIASKPFVGKLILAQFIFYCVYGTPNESERYIDEKKIYLYNLLALSFVIYPDSNDFLSEISLPINVDDFIILCSNIKTELLDHFPHAEHLIDLNIPNHLHAVIKLFMMHLTNNKFSKQTLKNINKVNFLQQINASYAEFRQDYINNKRNPQFNQIQTIHPLVKSLFLRFILFLDSHNANPSLRTYYKPYSTPVLVDKLFAYYKEEPSKIKLEPFLLQSDTFSYHISKNYIAFLDSCIKLCSTNPTVSKNEFFIKMFNFVMRALQKNNVEFDILSPSFNKLPLTSFMSEHKFDVATVEMVIVNYFKQSILYKNHLNKNGLKVNLIVLFLLFSQSKKSECLFIKSYYFDYIFKTTFDLLAKSMSLNTQEKIVPIRNCLFRNFHTFIKFIIYNMFNNKDTHGVKMEKFEVTDEWFSDFNIRYNNYVFAPFNSKDYQNPHFMKALIALADELKKWETNTSRIQPQNNLLINQSLFSPTPQNEEKDKESSPQPSTK